MPHNDLEGGKPACSAGGQSQPRMFEATCVRYSGKADPLRGAALGRSAGDRPTTRRTTDSQPRLWRATGRHKTATKARQSH